MRGFLSTPIGWGALLVVEILGLTALMRGLVRRFPDLSTTKVWVVAIALIAVVATLNYVIRRRYLSEG